MVVVETLEAWGHKNIRATNEKTLEITRENWLTKRGDCIIAVNATKGLSDLSEEFKRTARDGDAKITLELRVNSFIEVIRGVGNPLLTFRSPISMVIRKSDYTCDRTLMIHSDKATSDLNRNLVSLLQNPGQKIDIKLVVEL